MTIDPDLVARARRGDREAAEAVAGAIASDARSRRDAAAQRMNVAVGTIALVIFAVVWLRSGLSSSAFGLGVLIGLGIGVVIGVTLGMRQRGHSSRNDP